MIENRMLGEKFLLDKINFYMKPKQVEEDIPDYKIEIREIRTIAVASIKYKGKYSDIGKYMEKLYRAVGSHAEGCPFTLYYSAEYSDEADIECCLPVPAQLKQADAAIKQLSLVRAVCTKHKGGYNSLNRAYKTLLDYAGKYHFGYLTPFWGGGCSETGQDI